MAGPWEKYQAAPEQVQNGPWQKYGAAPNVSPAPTAGSAPPSSSGPIDLSAMGQKAFDLAGKFLDKPLMPESVGSQYEIPGVGNPAMAASTPRNLAIGTLVGAPGIVSRVAAGALSIKPLKEEIGETFAPGKTPMQRIESGVGAVLAGIPVAHGAGSLANDLRTSFVASMENGLHNSSVNWLDNARITESRKINDALQGAEAHSSSLRQGIITAHDAANNGQPTISAARLIPVMDDAKNAFLNIQSSTGGANVSYKMPQFTKLIDALSATNPVMKMDEVLKFRTLAGDLWRAASSDRDAAAIAKVRDALTNMAREASADIGQSKQFDSYNKIWSGTHSGEPIKHLDKLLNSTNGISFFNILNSDESRAGLNRMADNLATHGIKDTNGKPLIDKDYFDKVRSAHKDIYDYVNRPTGLRGVFSNLGRRTLAGGTGAVLGAAAFPPHPYIGALAGSTAGVALADRLAAIRNMSRLGNVSANVRAEGGWGPRVEPDFGGGLSGRVIEELKKGPSGGNKPTQQSIVSSPEEISRMQREDKQQSFIEQQMNRPVPKTEAELDRATRDRVTKGYEPAPGSTSPNYSDSALREVMREFNELKTGFRQRQGRMPTDAEEGRLWDAAVDALSPRRPYNPSISDKAKEVERIRAEKGKPVGEATRLANRKLGTPADVAGKDVQAQMDQAELLRKYLAGDPADVGRKVEELRQAIEKRKGKK